MNIGNAKFANLHRHSDIEPFEIVRWISPTTIDVRQMRATLDRNWQPEIAVGGFSGHCSNQDSQRWTYASLPESRTIRVRLTKKGWRSTAGMHVLSDQPQRFHDFNF